MAALAKVVLTDYVWESLEVEKKTLAGLGELVALQTKTPAEFLAQLQPFQSTFNSQIGLPDVRQLVELLTFAPS